MIGRVLARRGLHDAYRSRHPAQRDGHLVGVLAPGLITVGNDDDVPRPRAPPRTRVATCRRRQGYRSLPPRHAPSASTSFSPSAMKTVSPIRAAARTSRQAVEHPPGAIKTPAPTTGCRWIGTPLEELLVNRATDLEEKLLVLVEIRVDGFCRALRRPFLITFGGKEVAWLESARLDDLRKPAAGVAFQQHATVVCQRDREARIPILVRGAASSPAGAILADALEPVEEPVDGPQACPLARCLPGALSFAMSAASNSRLFNETRPASRVSFFLRRATPRSPPYEALHVA